MFFFSVLLFRELEEFRRNERKRRFKREKEREDGIIWEIVHENDLVVMIIYKKCHFFFSFSFFFIYLLTLTIVYNYGI